VRRVFLVVSILTILLAASTSADEPIARRLAALKSLVDPAAAQSVRQASAQSPGSCPLATWWQLTGYGREQRISDAVRDASLRYAVDAALIRAVIRHESAGDFRAVSHKGAQGLMQLMPGTARRVARQIKVGYSRKKLLSDPEYNLRLGRFYLAGLIDKYGGSYILALAAYNAGPARANRWMKDFGDPRTPEVDPVDWIESIPFNETRNYVQRILESLIVYHLFLGVADSDPVMAGHTRFRSLAKNDTPD